MTLTLIEGGPDCMRDDCMITVQSQQTTAVYYPPVYDKSGTNVNAGKNKTIQEVRCLSCGKNWKKEHYGT
jgi:transposase-like protein